MEITIESIDDVLPFIREDQGIIVSRRPDHSVIDYVFTKDGTFSCDVTLQCRGLKFDASGRIIARPFHKFFNVGEREDPNHIDWSQDHLVMDKLDGTMVHPAILNGELVFMTRMGVTDHAKAAQALASDQVLQLCREQIEQGRTPLFEYTGPENRIVLDYQEPKLTLLAAREIVSGRYVAHDELSDIAKRGKVRLVENFGRVDDIKSFMADGRALQDVEGYVIAFSDGHRLKLKADAYVLRHRALSHVHLEKNVLAWVATQAVDDVTPLLSPLAVKLQ
ncbi:MAG: hypothetical protein K0U74_04150 [Alphaproteobacteria bacterium]|nr:hypothetical protein [Alphaproteobacteria bacterium]